VEKVARQELKWAGLGETVLVVMPTPEAVALAGSLSAGPLETAPLIQTPVQAWWQLFFGQQIGPPIDE
jgi:hypothetical protein